MVRLDSDRIYQVLRDVTFIVVCGREADGERRTVSTRCAHGGASKPAIRNSSQGRLFTVGTFRYRSCQRSRTVRARACARPVPRRGTGDRVLAEQARTSSRVPMKLYFHLENGACEMPDAVGLELDSARRCSFAKSHRTRRDQQGNAAAVRIFQRVASEGGGPVSVGSFLAGAGLDPSEQSLAFDSAPRTLC